MKTQYIFLVIYTISLVSIASLVNNFVRGPYMDEIFHIPQAQQYCKGKYDEWNPKLTTPPGLNLLSFNALTLSLFPVGWFFNFLYYTDSGSTFFVLWSYLLSTEKKYWMSALVGGISVLFRQSNIIWNCFILGTSLLAVLSDSNYDSKINGRMSYYRGINIRSDIAIKEIKDFLILTLKNSPILFTIFFPYFLIFSSFIAFLIWNGGIVLGDKSNHTAVLHIPQIFYFISFTTIFSAPIILKVDYVDRLIT
ncbi:1087_t:CDS:2, partial [Funneliformis geosporum]